MHDLTALWAHQYHASLIHHDQLRITILAATLDLGAIDDGSLTCRRYDHGLQTQWWDFDFVGRIACHTA
jgi:hypothetical protein